LLFAVATFALAAGQGALAQGDRAAPEPSTPEAAPPVPEVSEADLEKFADVYVDLQKTAEKYEPEITGADSPEETLDAQTRLRDESLAKLSEHGWTLERYNAMVQAINASPALAERAVQLIQERS